MKIIIASSNQGKIQEFNRMMANNRFIELVPQEHLNIPVIEETGKSFIENALLKARNVFKNNDIKDAWVLADDSGLEINHLNSKPGIYSARYGNYDNSQDRNLAILKEMEGVEDRRARYCSSIVVLKSVDDATPLHSYGFCYGEITEKMQGENGFGYDPVFWLIQQQATMAQISATTKDHCSHRAKALKVILQQIRQYRWNK